MGNVFVIDIVIILVVVLKVNELKKIERENYIFVNWSN